MKVLLFAPESRCWHYLAPIANEIQERGHSFLFMFSQMTPLSYPYLPEHKDRFQVYTNVDKHNYGVRSQSLGIDLPFRPDFVILCRENWAPEQHIIKEFKETFNSKICLIEVNTHLINLIETKMEMLSRNKYPQNMIDIFFDQSEEAIETRVENSFDNGNRSIAVGNTLFDYNYAKIPRESYIKKYNIKTNEKKKLIMFYSLINVSRNKSLEIIKNISEKAGDEYQIFYKPYPGEPFDEKFNDVFKPEFFLSNVTPIIDHIDLIAMQKICDIHIGAMSSVMAVPLYLQKKIININNVCRYLEDGNNLDVYKKETDGYSDGSAKFWMDIHKDIKEMNTFEDFVDLVNLDDLEKFRIRNKRFHEIVKETTIDYDDELLCLKEQKKDGSKLLNMFDEFHDNNVSQRIIDILEVK